jgi:hypothetical protein
MRIAKDYGRRPHVRGKNFDVDALDFLCETYPSHGFVIDRSEAENLFKSVRCPSLEEQKLVMWLGDHAASPQKQSAIHFISEELPRSNHVEKPDAGSAAPNPRAAAGAGDSKRNAETPGRTKGKKATTKNVFTIS